MAISKQSGVLLGEIIEIVIIMGQREYVVQYGSKRFFVKASQCDIIKRK